MLPHLHLGADVLVRLLGTGVHAEVELAKQWRSDHTASPVTFLTEAVHGLITVCFRGCAIAFLLLGAHIGSASKWVAGICKANKLVF